MKIFTIGFTRKTAEVFFTRLAGAGVKRLVDIRLNNTSQLAGFSKQDDLRYFAKAICDMDYVHLPLLAPTAEILAAYQKDKKRGWESFERDFRALLRERHVEEAVSTATLNRGCLLCSEETADHCHRRLVAEYFARHLGEHGHQIDIVHL